MINTRLAAAFAFATSLSAGDLVMLKHGGLDCAPSRPALAEVRAARLKYYGTDSIDYTPPDTAAGEKAFNGFADTLVRTHSVALGKGSVEILAPKDRNGIMMIRTSKRVCYVWGKDLASLR